MQRSHRFFRRDLARDYTCDECVVALWSCGHYFSLVRQKCASTSERETRQVAQDPECITSKNAPAKAHAKQPGPDRIVSSRYSLGLLFKNVARTRVGVILTRARGSQSESLPIAAAFMQSRRFSRFSAPSWEIMISGRILFTVIPKHVCRASP